jgi:hypothetical protein
MFSISYSMVSVPACAVVASCYCHALRARAPLTPRPLRAALREPPSSGSQVPGVKGGSGVKADPGSAKNAPGGAKDPNQRDTINRAAEKFAPGEGGKRESDPNPRFTQGEGGKVRGSPRVLLLRELTLLCSACSEVLVLLMLAIAGGVDVERLRVRVPCLPGA